MGRVSDAKERLLEAAIHLLWESSYGAVTVDAICDRAGVKKGSFYYFFQSKSDLALAAIEADWQNKKPDLDAIFSPTVAPLERFNRYFVYIYKKQKAKQEKIGRVLGCYLFSLGSEVSSQDHSLCRKTVEILEVYLTYFESAIREAHAQGLIHAPSPRQKAKVLLAYFQGVLTHARMQNDLAPLTELRAGAHDLLGAKTSALAA